MNNFLKTREGLQYLMLKYRHLDIESALKEFTTNVVQEIYEKN